MSSIKILFTEHFGQIIGEVSESISGTYTIKNPCVVQISNQQVAFLPLLATTLEKELVLPASKIIGNPFTPETDIYNYYSTQFSSGIQLTTDSKVR